MKATKLIFKTFLSSAFKAGLLSSLIVAQVHFAYAQTASILPPAKTTFLDQNGKPLTGGTVKFYIPGTTTPKTTWQDSGETVPNTNPVILDSAGRGIILGDGSYRQEVFDKKGNLIWDQQTSSTGSGGGGTTATVGDGDAVGTVKPWAGFTAPSQYIFSYGQELARSSFPELLAATTSLQNVSCTSTSTTLSGLSDTSQIPIGAHVESICVNAGTTVVSKTVSTLVVSAAAIVTTNSSIRIFPFGNGNGSSTFNTPDLRGRVLAGRDNMGGVAASRLTTSYFGANASAIGATGGNESTTLLTTNLPPYTPTITLNTTDFNGSFQADAQSNCSGCTSPAPWGNPGGTPKPTATGTPQGGISAPINVVQPTETLNWIIKVLPDTNPNSYFGVASIGGMTGVLTCGTGLTCAGNNISAVSASGNPGGSSGQIQYNNAGAFAGFTTSGDATVNTGTGALTLSTVNANVGSFGSATSCPAVTVNAKGLITAASAATCTPAVGSITGLGTGVTTALSNNIGTAGAPVVYNGAGGTPSAITLTNGTGLPIASGVSGLASGIASWLATPSSANLLAALTTKTGTGNSVFGSAPTIDSLNSTTAMTLSFVTGLTQCLQVNASGVLSGTGAPCGAGGGSVTGPGSSTNTAVPTWNGTIGAALNNSGVLIDASNNMTIPGLVGIGAASLAANDLRLYSSSRTVLQRHENDQNLSIGSVIGNDTYFGKNASGTSLQWAGFTAGVDDCRYKLSFAGAPCAANEASAGTETGGYYINLQNGSGVNNVAKADDDGLFVNGQRNLFISAGQGVVWPDGSRTMNYGISYNSGASATFTVTIASPAVFSATAHGLSINDSVYLTTTGALPTGLTASTVSAGTGKSTTVYYVIAAGFTANTFELSATVGGSAINTSGSQSGVHTFVQGTNEVDIQSCNGVGINCAANTGVYLLASAGKRAFGVKSIGTANPIVTSTVHHDVQGTTPSNNCTGASQNGDDHAGRIVTTSTSCTVTFNSAYVNQISACVVTFRSGAGTRTYSCNVSGITVSGLSGSSEIFDYIVFGN